MMNNRFFSLLTLVAIPAIAQAQPDLNTPPKTVNPTNRPVGGARNLTPEDRFKRQLTQAKVTSPVQQTAVVTYVTEELKARQTLQQTAQALQVSLRNKNITDAQVAGLLNDYSVAVADDKARHQKALTTLKAVVNVAQFPRLEAMLTIAGLYGDAPALSMSGMTALIGKTTKRDNADGNDRRNRRADARAGVGF